MGELLGRRFSLKTKVLLRLLNLGKVKILRLYSPLMKARLAISAAILLP